MENSIIKRTAPNVPVWAKMSMKFSIIQTFWNSCKHYISSSHAKPCLLWRQHVFISVCTDCTSPMIHFRLKWSCWEAWPISLSGLRIKHDLRSMHNAHPRFSLSDTPTLLTWSSAAPSSYEFKPPESCALPLPQAAFNSCFSDFVCQRLQSVLFQAKTSW